MLDGVGLGGMGDGAILALIGAATGIVLGLAARLGRFCTLGAVEDILYGQSDKRLRMWGLAIGTAMTCVFALVLTGAFDLSEAVYHGIAFNPLAAVVGGLMFGYGMALAGNCGYGALARLGGGDLRAFFVVLVLGVTAMATASGPLAWLRIRLFPEPAADLGTPAGYADLIGRALGISPGWVGLTLGLALIAVAVSGKSLRTKPRSIVWGAAVGLAVAAGWAGTSAVHDGGFGAGPVISHSFARPLGDALFWVMTASGGGINFAVGSVFGVLAGAFVGSFGKGHFRWEACEDPRELKRQIGGAAIMGVGAVIAVGCTVGQGISAFAVLSFSAPLVFLSIIAGAALGLRQLIEGFARQA